MPKRNVALSYMNSRIFYLVLFVILVLVVLATVYRGPAATQKTTTASSTSTAISNLHYDPDANEFDSAPIQTPCMTGTPCRYKDVVDFRVVVLTFNRSESLSKLLRSLDSLQLDGDRAALEIWIDRDREKGVNQQTNEVASAFKWKGGATRVHVQVSDVVLEA